MQAEAKATVQLGAAAILELGQIKATVFLDRNNDRLFNVGDEKLPAIGVLMADGEKRSSDKNGEALFEEIIQGRHVVALDERTLPDNFELVGESSRMVNVLEAEHAEVEFPVKTEKVVKVVEEYARLDGRVFYDKNSNDKYEAGEPLLARFNAVFDDRLINRGKKGAFVFSHIPTGRHTIMIKYGRRFYIHEVSIKNGRNKEDFPLKYGMLKVSIHKAE